jgi:hypothetical protein
MAGPNSGTTSAITGEAANLRLRAPFVFIELG